MARTRTPELREWLEERTAHRDSHGIRPWVVWGVGQPLTTPGGDPADRNARALACQCDPRWCAYPDGWVVVIHADAAHMRHLAEASPSVMGYVPYWS